MPQMKKVVLAMGNRLIYSDTYEQAISELAGMPQRTSVPAPPGKGAEASGPPPGLPDTLNRTLQEISTRLRRYRELMGQGQYAEAGTEMEALERLSRSRQ